MGQATKLIQPPQDIIAFVKTLHIPETLTVSKHVFSPPQPADPAQVCIKFCSKVCNKYEIFKESYKSFQLFGQIGLIWVEQKLFSKLTAVFSYRQFPTWYPN